MPLVPGNAAVALKRIRISRLESCYLDEHVSGMTALPHMKARVRAFWDHEPCGTGQNPHAKGSAEYFSWIERQRNEREPFIARFARWPEWRGRRILEMGTGAGTDFIRFARAGAVASGVDLTEAGVRLVRQRLALEGLSANALVADVEHLPFPDGHFDFVYSWGVIHHTEDTPAAAREALRVLRPGGEFCVMIYHRWSLHCLRGYLKHGLLKGRIFLSIDDIARDHFESYGTKVYTVAEARLLFPDVDVKVTHVLTPYDFQYSASGYLPRMIQRLVPSHFGYFLVLEGRRRS
jgi:SAM-dependent methyltransferase